MYVNLNIPCENIEGHTDNCHRVNKIPNNCSVSWGNVIVCNFLVYFGAEFKNQMISTANRQAHTCQLKTKYVRYNYANTLYKRRLVYVATQSLSKPDVYTRQTAPLYIFA